MHPSPIRDIADDSSASRALRVLDVLARRGHPMTSMAIATECSIPRSTIYRLLSVMRDRGYLEHETTGRRWSLGPHVAELRPGVATLGQALRVLESFDATTPRLAAAEIATRTGLDAGLTMRLVATLLDEGLLSADERGGFALGLRIVGLAARARPVEHLLRTARPHLEQLRERTGETANLLVRDGSSALYLDQVDSPRALRVSGWTGRRIPLAGSASGAALTSHGVHVAADAVEPGIIAVACGVRNVGPVRAAVSITAPTARLRGSLLSHAEQAVEEAARAIGWALTAGTTGASLGEAPATGHAAARRTRRDGKEVAG